jgi:hypothetical protein
MTIILLGKPKKRTNVLKDIPEGVTLTEWITLKEKQRKDKVNARLDGLTYERDPESPE